MVRNQDAALILGALSATSSKLVWEWFKKDYESLYAVRYRGTAVIHVGKAVLRSISYSELASDIEDFFKNSSPVPTWVSQGLEKSKHRMVSLQRNEKALLN